MRYGTVSTRIFELQVPPNGNKQLKCVFGGESSWRWATLQIELWTSGIISAFYMQKCRQKTHPLTSRHKLGLLYDGRSSPTNSLCTKWHPMSGWPLPSSFFQISLSSNRLSGPHRMQLWRTNINALCNTQLHHRSIALRFRLLCEEWSTKILLLLSAAASPFSHSILAIRQQTRWPCPEQSCLLSFFLLWSLSAWCTYGSCDALLNLHN